jgi:16S rRNA (uracil1498-N3)-methyltransferase
VHRFFLPPEECGRPTLTLSERDRHHALRVLRLEPGDSVEVLDGAGRAYSCRIVRADKQAVVAEVKVVHLQQKPPPIGLAPSLLKGRSMDMLLQKATELGATAISPIITSRTVVQLDSKDLEDRRASWELSAREACKQCGNAWLPRVDPPRALRRFLENPDQAWRVAAMLRAEAGLPAEVWDKQPDVAEGVVFLTGPEGDFTFDEQEEIVAAGVTPVTLGPRVLRAETAALAGLAILQHEWARRRPGGACPDSRVGSGQ